MRGFEVRTDCVPTPTCGWTKPFWCACGCMIIHGMSDQWTVYWDGGLSGGLWDWGKVTCHEAEVAGSTLISGGWEWVCGWRFVISRIVGYQQDSVDKWVLTDAYLFWLALTCHYDNLKKIPHKCDTSSVILNQIVKFIHEFPLLLFFLSLILAVSFGTISCGSLPTVYPVSTLPCSWNQNACFKNLQIENYCLGTSRQKSVDIQM